MSEAIIARGGKGIGQQVDLSGINASLVSINTRINQINSNLGSLWDTVNDISSGALDTATNTMIVSNGYYNCTKTGNYWVEIAGGGSGAASGMFCSGGGSGYLNNRRILLNKGDSIYVTIGSGGAGNRNISGSGGTTSFGSYLSANGGSSAYGTESAPGIGANNGASGGMGMICDGGYLYYNSSNGRRISVQGTTRLYYGDGGRVYYGRGGSLDNSPGNSGCCIVTYIN